MNEKVVILLKSILINIILVFDLKTYSSLLIFSMNTSILSLNSGSIILSSYSLTYIFSLRLRTILLNNRINYFQLII